MSIFNLKNSILLSLKIIGLTLVVLILIESMSFVINKRNNQAKPFLVDFKLAKLKSKNHAELGRHGYFLVDPLLGWGITDYNLKQQQYDSQYNCVYLKSPLSCPQAFNILITGGSTSDVFLNPNNWPTFLVDILADKNICADIYIGAVGGYSSGQEALKLIRDGQKIDLDLHISYSGANEYNSPNYVSRQERSLYLNIFDGVHSYGVFPNTLNLLKHKNEQKLELYDEEIKDPGEFWLKNMQIMHAINLSNETKFVGILQPVLGVNNEHQQNIINLHAAYVDQNKSFYPQLVNQLDTISYLKDLSYLFDDSQEEVFLDDCHLNDRFQESIAYEIFTIINTLDFQEKRIQN